VVQSLTWALECDRGEGQSVLLQVLEVDRGEGRRQTRRIRRSKFDEAKLQRFGQQAGSRGFMKWIPKGCEVSNCKEKPKGPKFVREPNLVA